VNQTVVFKTARKKRGDIFIEIYFNMILFSVIDARMVSHFYKYTLMVF